MAELIVWIKDDTKRCCSCKDYKTFDQFHKDRTGINGLAFSCKSCACVRARKNHRKRFDERPEYRAAMKLRYIKATHGISTEEYEQKLLEQNHTCAICGTTTPKGGWHLDHNHDTGKHRDFLCSPCNRGLGYMQDNREILLNAVKYLDKHNDNAAAEREGRSQ